MEKILIVDDAAFLRMVIKEHLKKVEYTDFIEATDGEEAVAQYIKHSPDLVMMDITMPNKDGLSALKEIMALDPSAKVIMCSAMGQETYVTDAIKAGAVDFLVKPFKQERLVNTVQNILKTA